MASFRESVYSKRTNLDQFCSALLSGISNWTEVTARSGRRPGEIRRCEIEGGTAVCNYRPVHRDKMRVRALVKAWKRQISDRYLDLQLASRVHNRRGVTVEAAYDLLRQNASQGGCVMFVRDELNAARVNNQPTFFGSRMFANYNWNTYFTSLLRWDDRHCYGLLQSLERQSAVSSGAGGSQDNWFQACRNFIRNTMQHSGRSIYHEYNIQFA